MNSLTEAIRQELDSCSDLLAVFQQERQLYCSNLSIGIAEVTSILNRKKQLVEIFDRQHLLVKAMRDEGGKCSDQEQTEHKDLMRRLGTILEQLLVIDHENEKMLRDNISSRRIGSVSQPNNIEARIRPALQRQMPFIPGMRPAATTAPATPLIPNITPANRIRTAVSAVTPIEAKIEAAAEIPVEAPAAPAIERTEPTGAKHLLRRYFQNGGSLASKYA